VRKARERGSEGSRSGKFEDRKSKKMKKAQTRIICTDRSMIRLVLLFIAHPCRGSDAKRAASPVQVKNILSKSFQFASFFCHWEWNISQLVSGRNVGRRFWLIKKSSQKPVYISQKRGLSWVRWLFDWCA
jgi:hypothetical protein